MTTKTIGAVMERDEPAMGPIEQFVADDTDPLLNSAATSRDLRNLANRIDSQFLQLDARLSGQTLQLGSDLRDKINTMGFALAGLIIASNLSMFAVFLSLR